MKEPSPFSWQDSLLRPIREELRLREVLMAVRRAQLNEHLRAEDQLKVKSTIFLSSVALFNLSLLSIYAIHRTPAVRRVVVVPSLLLLFGASAYKLSVEWLNREILRSLESQQS
jgi:hypothetical protein